jgi:superfamily I DNA/RNA helicase
MTAGSNAHLARLSPTQRKAATESGGCLVVAVPGAGKTGTLAARATHLLLQGKSVVAVTFTRDGALELRHRIAKLVPPDAMDRLLVGTFHSICLLMAFPGNRKSKMGGSLLRAQRSGESRKWNIALEGERRTYAFAAAEEAGLDCKPEEITPIIEAVKAGEPPKSSAEAATAMLYDRKLSAAGKIDFQDIILKVVAGMDDGTISTLRTDHLLVDEFQDTDATQYRWMMAHHRAGVRVTAVGDDDQSIYQFRRALGYQAMVSFVEDTRCPMHRLEENYRSHAEILAPAQRVIENARNRMEKVLVAHKGPGGTANVIAYPNRKSEASAIADRAKMHLERGESFAVLARTNLRLDEIEAAMSVKGVPYTRSDGDSILNSAEAAVLMDLTETLQRDDAGKRTHILIWSGVSADDLDRLGRIFGGELVEGGSDDFKGQGVSDQGVSVWRSYAKMSKQWARLDRDGLSALALTGIIRWLKDRARNKYSQTTLDLCASIFEPRDGETLADRVRDIRLASKSRKDRDADTGTGARLMTAHGSKGLEFDAVCVAGVENDVWPDKKSPIDEERRLFYVAITRARKHLVMSCETNKVKPSPFLAETGLSIEHDRFGGES